MFGARAFGRFICLCLLVSASPLLGQTWPGDTTEALLAARTRVDQAAESLIENPNSPARHLAMAKAYFYRGAVGDSSLVKAHLERAVELDPDMEGQVKRFLDRANAGARGTALSAEERALDRRVATTLPQSPLGGGTTDDLITTSLAEKVMRRDFRVDATSFQEVREDICRVFGWNAGDKEDQAQWPERLQTMKLRPASPGWQGSFENAVFASIEEFNSASALRAGWNRQGGSSASTESNDEEDEVPNPLESRTKAIQAWVQREPAKAVDHLIDVVAATEVERAKANDEAPVLAQESSSPSPFTTGLPESPSSPSTPWTTATAEGPSQEERLPPDVNRELGQRGMEALEAMSNPEVSTGEVSQKVVETAVVGAVGEPLVLDLDGNGQPGVASLLPNGRLQGEPVRFDLDGDGHMERCEWLLPGQDGLLAVDLNEDGIIDRGQELFGTATGDRDGFCRLRRFDLDGDGWIRSIETKKLLVWKDDGDGICSPDELRSLADWGITALSCRNEGPVASVEGPGPVRKVWEWYPDTRLR